jgi:hypothetical protein
MSYATVSPADVIASGIGKNGEKINVLQIVIPEKASEIKAYGTTKFYKVKMTASSCRNQQFGSILAGHKVPLDISIPMDPSTFKSTDKEKESSNTKRASLCLKLSQCGDFGRALEIIERDFLEQYEINKAKLWTSTRKQPLLTTPMKRNYGENTKKEGMEGKPYDDPLVNLKLDFTTYPESFKKLAGVPKTIVYNWATRTIEGSCEKFQELTDST